MGTKARQVDIGTARAIELIRRAGQENRQARQDRGLSLRAVARAVGLSESQVSRIERGLIAHVSVADLARLHAVVGLDLSLKSYPAGQPIRDIAQVELLDDFRKVLHRSIRWATEAPLPIPGDRRSWDALIGATSWRYGVEAETAPRDAQALARRLQLKQRDGDVDGVLLVLRRTEQTRRFMHAVGGMLAGQFAVEGGRALELLQAGADPGGSAIIVLPLRDRRRLAAPASTAR